jgi:hypothetical protein
MVMQITPGRPLAPYAHRPWGGDANVGQIGLGITVH